MDLEGYKQVPTSPPIPNDVLSKAENTDTIQCIPKAGKSDVHKHHGIVCYRKEEDQTKKT